MKLNQYEVETALWKKIDAELTDRLDTLRAKNDGLLDERTTSFVRGCIAEVKQVLAWGIPDQEAKLDF
jgi:hypothetical protein